MQIRFLEHAPGLKIKKGQIIECGESRARHYVAKGVAEFVEENPIEEKKEGWLAEKEITKDLRKGKKKKSASTS